MRGDTYPLGESPAEIEHLVRQAEVYAEEADQLLDRIGIARGATVVDVGCGVLGILHVLRARVGPRGRVVGVDREAGILAHARRIAGARDLDVELVQDDATALGLPGDEFDLVHCRSLLLNVADRAAVLAGMVRIAKPTGVVAVQEPDAAAWLCEPPHPAFDTLREELVAAYARSGKPFNIGRRLAGWLGEAGLHEVRVRATTRVTRPGDYFHTFLLTVTGLIRAEILAGGRLTADQFDSCSAALRQHLAEPDTLTCQPAMWQAWGRKK